jgi:anthranilate synthase component 1
MDTSREAFVDLAEGSDSGSGERTAGRPAVVRATATLDADVDPLTAYAALAADDGYAYLLESGEKVASSDPDGAFAPEDVDRHARYSFVGYDPAAVVTVDGEPSVEVLDERYAGLVDPVPQSAAPDTLEYLRAALPEVDLRGFPDADRQRLEGGLVGFLAYDAVYDLFLEEVGVERPETRVPDAQFVLGDRTVVFDQREGTVRLVFTPVVRPDEDAGAVYDDLAAEADRVVEALRAAAVETGGFRRIAEEAGPREEYEDAVRRAKEHVRDGDIYQGVISRKRELYGDVDPLGLYAELRRVNPSPYMYVLAHRDRTIVGASPETLVSVRGREVMANPIAGTCDRGTSPVEDRRLAGEMLADEKERAEHTMLVDLARNDVRRVSESGSVRVEEFMNVLKYSHVQHIESTVTGRLRGDSDAFDATRAAFPAGTLSGAPKIRAMEIIDALEGSPRGVYGGGVGYYSWTGDADFAIVIRTATVDHGVTPPDGGAATDRVTVRAGAGIVADSDPGKEYRETEQKMRGVLVALEAIEEAGVDEASAGPEVSR